MTDLIIALTIIYFTGSFIYFVCTGLSGHHYFNPVENYYSWEKLNIVGVLFFTLLLNLLFTPFALLYWVIKLFCFIFTVGRK